MSLHSILLLATVILLLLTMFSSMVGAWVWAIHRVRQGRPLLAAAPPRSVPWGLGSIVLVLLVYIAVNIGVAVAYHAITAQFVTPPAGERREPPISEQMLVFSLANGIVVLVVPALLRLCAGARLADLGVERSKILPGLLIGLVGFLLVTPVVYAFNLLAAQVWTPNTHKLQEMVKTEPAPGVAQLAILSAVILAPAAEELIFRGIVQTWLVRAFTRRREVDASPLTADHRESETAGIPDPLEIPPAPFAPAETPLVRLEPLETLPAPLDPLFSPSLPAKELPDDRNAVMLAIIVTSVLFAAMHLPQWPAPLAIFGLSLALGVVYQRSGNLIAAIVMHAFFNSLGTLVLLGSMLQGIPKPEKPNPPTGHVAAPAGQADAWPW